MKKYQTGFGTTGVLIILLSIMSIAGTGYVVSRRNGAKNSPDPAPKTVTKEQKLPASSNAEEEVAKADPNLKTIEIKEWGITGSTRTDHTLTYKVDDKNSNLIVFNSAELAAADPMCADYAGGGIGRLKPDQLVYPEVIADYTAEQFATDPRYEDSARLIKKVGDSYYYFYGRQGPCGTDGAELQSETQNIVIDLLQSFRPLSN